MLFSNSQVVSAKVVKTMSQKRLEECVLLTYDYFQANAVYFRALANMSRKLAYYGVPDGAEVLNDVKDFKTATNTFLKKLDKIDKKITKLKKKGIIKKADTLLNYLRSCIKFNKSISKTYRKAKLSASTLKKLENELLRSDKRSEKLEQYCYRLMAVYA